MSTHTPAPWPAPEYDNDDCSGGCWYDIPGICRAIYTEENAKLIRSAPELLAALRDLVDRDWTYTGAEADTGDLDSLYNRIKRGRAAIARATGMQT